MESERPRVDRLAPELSGNVELKLTAARLARIRSVFAKDGQFAQVLLLNKAGQNFAFTIPFAELGTLIGALQKLARDMGQRLARAAQASEAQIAEGMSGAAAVIGLAVGSDRETGEGLVWFETAEGGALSFRLSDELCEELHTALQAQRGRRSKAAE